MDKKIKTAFLVSVLLQALHSLEEYIYKLYEVFPPLTFIDRHVPAYAKPAFIVFNTLLVSSGLLSFFYWVRPDREGARTVVWIWVGIQVLTVAAHTIWAAYDKAYHPGLATAPLFVPVLAYLIGKLFSETQGGRE